MANNRWNPTNAREDKEENDFLLLKAGSAEPNYSTNPISVGRKYFRNEYLPSP